MRPSRMLLESDTAAKAWPEQPLASARTDLSGVVSDDWYPRRDLGIALNQYPAALP